MSLDSRFLDSPKMANRGLIRTRIVANLWDFWANRGLIHARIAFDSRSNRESLLESSLNRT